MLRAAPVHHAENDGHEKQRCHRRENQPANDSPAKGRILLAALAPAESHRDHPMIMASAVMMTGRMRV